MHILYIPIKSTAWITNKKIQKYSEKLGKEREFV